MDKERTLDLDDANWVMTEEAIGGGGDMVECGIAGEVMEVWCRRCGDPPKTGETRLAFGLCPDCYSDLCEKADSLGSESYHFKNVLGASYELHPGLTKGPPLP